MSGIPVVIRKPRTDTRLYPYYDRDAEFLVFESAMERPWRRHFDIDGLIVLDLDESLLLANVDFHTPMDLWRRGLSREFDWSAPAGDLEFTESTIAERTVDSPVRASTDDDGRIVLFEIGVRVPDRTVALSENCLALLAGSELVGFVARDFERR